MISKQSHDALAAAVQPLPVEDRNYLLEGIGIMPTADDLDLEWPIEGIIHPVLTCITGQPEVGKSTLLQSLCRSLLRGTPWLGRSVNFDPRKRILFGCEDFGGVKRLRDLFPAECAQERLLAFRLDQWTERRLTADKMHSSGIGLMIIDSAYSAAGDLNDQTTSAAFLATLRGLGAPVVVVHHEAKASGIGPAGAQAYRAAYRHTIRVTASKARPLELTLGVSGNDVTGETLKVAVDRSTVEATPISRQPGDTADTGRRRRLSKHDRVAALVRYGLSVGVQPPTAGGHNAYATALLGGSRGNEDPARQAAVAQAIGRKTIGQQALAILAKEIIGEEVSQPAAA